MHKSIFVSDTHLGSSWSNSNKLFTFLENIEAEQLFLVGDIVNSTATQEHLEVTKFIQLIQKKEWKIIYIAGNHEEERVYSPAVSLSFSEELLAQTNYVYHSGKTSVYLEHGHRFHTVSRFNRVSGRVFRYLKRILLQRERVKRSAITENIGTLKQPKESFYLRYVKPFSQRLLRYSFKSYMAERAKEQGCSVVVCGHFHIAENSRVKGVQYLNCGDWVKDSSYVVETQEGEFMLKRWG